MKAIPVSSQQIAQAHALYCRLTGQNLSLGFDRERMWYELLRLGNGPEQIRQVILYLQREIRADRRNVGALKLSNFLQPDRFEEDLNTSRVMLKPASPPKPSPPPPPRSIHPRLQEQGRKRALECLQKLKEDLRINPGSGKNVELSTRKSEKNRQISTDQSEHSSTD